RVLKTVKSQHKGDTSSRSFLGQNNLEWRADDQSRADAIDGLAPPGASGGRRQRAQCGAHLPAIRPVATDILQMAEAAQRPRRRGPLRPASQATPLAAVDAERGCQQDPVLATALPFRTE